MTLENQLQKAMIDLYHQTVKATYGKYKPTQYLELIGKWGGVEAARRLLSGKDPQYGFEILRNMRRADLTFERFILQHPEFHCFLDPEHLKTAKQRISDYDM